VGRAAIVNPIAFLMLMSTGVSLTTSTLASFAIAAIVNYYVCIAILFRHKVRWNSLMEAVMYVLVVSVVLVIDLGTTSLLLSLGLGAGVAKSLSSLIGLFFNFLGLQFLVFGEPGPGTEGEHKAVPAV
jgi:putative flippase GtrA